MAKKIWLWLLIGLSGFFLVFRAVTPFWLDVVGIAVALMVLLWGVASRTGTTQDQERKPGEDS